MWERPQLVYISRRLGTDKKAAEPAPRAETCLVALVVTKAAVGRTMQPYRQYPQKRLVIYGANPETHGLSTCRGPSSGSGRSMTQSIALTHPMSMVENLLSWRSNSPSPCRRDRLGGTSSVRVFQAVEKVLEVPSARSVVAFVACCCYSCQRSPADRHNGVMSLVAGVSKTSPKDLARPGSLQGARCPDEHSSLQISVRDPEFDGGVSCCS